MLLAERSELARKDHPKLSTTPSRLDIRQSTSSPLISLIHFVTRITIHPGLYICVSRQHIRHLDHFPPTAPANSPCKKSQTESSMRISHERLTQDDHPSFSGLHCIAIQYPVTLPYRHDNMILVISPCAYTHTLQIHRGVPKHRYVPSTDLSPLLSAGQSNSDKVKSRSTKKQSVTLQYA